MGDFLYLIPESENARRRVIESRVRRGVKRQLSVGGLITIRGTLRDDIPMSSSGVSRGKPRFGRLDRE